MGDFPGRSVRALTRKIKAEARRIGFQIVGVTSPEPPPHLAVYENWLAAGRHGEMEYLATGRARRRRRDPRQILAECQSILTLGIRHPSPRAEEKPENAGPLGRVAAYAWGDDYHDVLTDRLRALVSFIEEQVGQSVANRWYTDTGPILERELAQRAGLGWIGKNTCLIHPRRGSYFLLAQILLGVQLAPDQPFSADHCGSCTRCIEACPTDCILPDRTIDARRCISYLTIELKGSIPVELRPPMGDWVFGCDICQEVCPWNIRFAEAAGDPAFAPRAEVAFPDLQTEIFLTPAAFNRKFQGNPVKRPKRRGYLRNVAVALGNSGDPRAAPHLARVLSEEPEPVIRGHAAWALGRIGGSNARAALTQTARTENHPDVREEIEAALSRL